MGITTCVACLCMNLTFCAVLDTVEKHQYLNTHFKNKTFPKLSLKLVPSVEFREKLDDVWIDPRNVALHHSAEVRKTTIPSNGSDMLRKYNSYQCDLILGKSAIRLDDRSHC